MEAVRTSTAQKQNPLNQKMPAIHNREFMYHPATRIVGQVVDTIYPPDNRIEKVEQVLRLKDGTRRQFLLVELHPATSVAIEKFLAEARSCA